MKEYLLLRNNKQTGPYSIDELKEMGLKPFDLLWVQHKSFSWKYPSEIDALAAIMPAIENITTATSMPDERTVSINEAVIAEMAGADRYFNAAEKQREEETPVKYISHIVALKPSIDHIQVKTIKYTGQPSIIKVELRDKEIPAESNNRKEVALNNDRSYTVSDADLLSEYVVAPAAAIPITHAGSNNFVQSKKYIAEPDNKLEWMVLIIGATSLMAIVYLLITSPY